ARMTSETTNILWVHEIYFRYRLEVAKEPSPRCCIFGTQVHALSFYPLDHAVSGSENVPTNALPNPIRSPLDFRDPCSSRTRKLAGQQLVVAAFSHADLLHLFLLSRSRSPGARRSTRGRGGR